MANGTASPARLEALVREQAALANAQIGSLWERN